jgi:hypothetical protein
MQLARRSVGLEYTTMQFDDYFQNFCKIIFKYQFVEQKTEISDAIIDWLYQHSAGVISVVVELIHDAQEIAILTGQEMLNLDTLNQAYTQRLALLHDYIQPTITHNRQSSKPKKKKVATDIVEEKVSMNKGQSLKNIVEQAKLNNLDIVHLLKEYYTVVEVKV